MSVGVSLRHLSVLDTILDLIPKPAVCGQEIQCRKQGIVAAVHVPADLQEHGAVYFHKRAIYGNITYGQKASWT